jgi:hypothetical protein
MNKLLIPRPAFALRFMMNKLHLSSLTSCAPKICSLLLITVFGLTQALIPSVAKARPKARLVFFESYYVGPKNLSNGFSMPTGIGKSSGKSIRKTDHGDMVYGWQFPETIGPGGAKFQIGAAASANGKGGGVNAVIGCIGIPVQETNLYADVSVIANPGEGVKKASQAYTIVPRPAYESSFVDFKIRCHGGFDMVFRYNVEQ